MTGVNGVPQQLSTMQDRFNFTRTGIITQVDPFAVTMDFTVSTNTGDETTTIRAAYVRQSEPSVGDTVTVMRQGASWFVVGTSSGTGGNLVENPSFEQVDSSLFPIGWTLYAISGTPSMQSVEVGSDETVEGDRLLEVVPDVGASSSNFVYSSPISVAPGQVWELSAYVNARYPGDNANTLDVAVWGLWFANATDLYPTTSAADIQADTAPNIAETDLMQILRGTVTVPVGAVFMRVGLRSAISAYTASRWDFVTSRRVS
jgi:hypothetical protein